MGSGVEGGLPRSGPEEQGVDSAGVRAFVEAADETIRDLHSFMVVRHGHVIAEGWWEPYRREEPHMLFSLSKSFTSTAAGLVIAEGRLSLEDTVLSFFPEDAPAEVSENLAAMKVRHLLSMSTGHAEDTLGFLARQTEGNWVKAFLERPVEYEPGTHFLYNSGATYMVSAIVQKLTGMKVVDYLEPRLFEPLGITGADWEVCPRGINVGGWGLSLKTEDIAKFGELYLRKGVWNGKRLIPEEWVEQATSKQVSNGDDPNSDWAQGYGYQFWRSRCGAYRGDGAFGQFCVVMPEQDAVFVTTAGVGDMQGVLNLVWEKLLPALRIQNGERSTKDGEQSTNNKGALESASSVLGSPSSVLGSPSSVLGFPSLILAPPSGERTSPMVERVSGKTYRRAEEAPQEGNEPTFLQPSSGEIEWVQFDFEGSSVTIWAGGEDHRIAIGQGGEWVRGMTGFNAVGSRPVAASGAWASEDTYVLKLCYTTTPFCPTLTFRFEGDRLLLDYRSNVSFGPLERPRWEGKW